MKLELFPDRINYMTMTLYIFNLAITCYVIPDVFRYFIVCQLNMVFGNVDKILIKKLYHAVEGI